jgi:hypothetical protein
MAKSSGGAGRGSGAGKTSPNPKLNVGGNSNVATYENNIGGQRGLTARVGPTQPNNERSVSIKSPRGSSFQKVGSFNVITGAVNSVGKENISDTEMVVRHLLSR